MAPGTAVQALVQQIVVWRWDTSRAGAWLGAEAPWHPPSER